MRNIVDDSTVWAKVRRLLLFASLVFAIATTAIAQTLPITNYQLPTIYIPQPWPINEPDTMKDYGPPIDADSDTSVLSNHVACDKAIADTSFITKKEMVLYKNVDPVGIVLIIVVILLQLASIWILLHYRVKPKLDSSDNGEMDAKIKELNGEIIALNSSIDDWRSQTGYKNPKDAKDRIEELEKKHDKIQEEKKSLEQKFCDFQKKVKDTPESFKDNREYKKLSELIEKSQKFDSLSNNPDLINPATESGKLIAAGRLLKNYLNNPTNVTTGNHAHSLLASIVRKGIFLDKAKDDLQVVIGDREYIADSVLQKAASCVEEPYKILRTDLNAYGLYKLISDLKNIADALMNSKEITAEAVTSDEMKDKLKPVMDGLIRYQKYGDYQNYWSNIQRPLFDVLNNLHNHDDSYNMRALMFYCSQFYSIAETIRNIQRGNTNPPVYDWNVSLFNNADAPSIGKYGIPDISDDALKDFKFRYTGAPDEDKRRNYFNRFAPMRFILISTYYFD